MNGYEVLDDYIRAIPPGQYVTRRQMQALFNVQYTTARFHLERAVRRGLLVKLPGYIGKQSGWLYSHPDTQPRLFADDLEQDAIHTYE